MIIKNNLFSGIKSKISTSYFLTDLDFRRTKKKGYFVVIIKKLELLLYV